VEQTKEIILSDEQEAAAKKFVEWFDNFEDAKRKYFVLEGFAGTGKSFSVKEMIDRVKCEPQYMAYTGKAALVLNKYSQVNATTIHSAIYRLKQVPDSVFERLYAQMEKAAGDAAKEEIKKEIEELKKPQFELNHDALEGVELLVLDECSMVDDEILGDLLSFGIPIIALGDPGQLPPVKGEGALFRGMPDARLTEIRRQALESPIIQWSMWARNKRTLPMTSIEDRFENKCAKVPVGMLTPQQFVEEMARHNITICWKNVTRQKLNQIRRKSLGYSAENSVFPVIGDTLIITKNDKELGVFNGQFCTVMEFGREFDNYIETVVEAEGMEKPVKLNLHRVTFEEYHDPRAKDRYRPWDYRNTHMADFGYAITCHKAQGSQWDKVLIVDENVLNWPGKYDERAQWLYTAITRAADKLTIVAGKI